MKPSLGRAESVPLIAITDEERNPLFSITMQVRPRRNEKKKKIGGMEGEREEEVKVEAI